MKILLVNTYDRGGAANACKRLHKALLSKGAKSKVLLLVKNNDWPQSFRFVPKPILSSVSKVEKIKKKFLRFSKKIRNKDATKGKDRNSEFLQERNPHLELFSFPYSRYNITETALYKEADIINLHWVANFLDFPSFFEKTDKPVVWTLHDMNPFTGGEHYEEEFLGIDEKGLPIRRTVTEIEKKEFKKVIQLKKAALKNFPDLTIVAPSRWLAKKAENSEVFKGRQVFYIPYGLDTEVFAPRDRKFSRQLLNIPEDKKMILFVADSTNSPRKGFEYLFKAFNFLSEDDIVLCAVGNKNGESNLNTNIRDLGTIQDERLLSVVYSAADVFVIPSLMDNLPNTVLESLMCGTPVIGFPVGGIPEMIIHGENGLLTKEISVNSLVESLENFLSEPGRFDRNKIGLEAKKKYNGKIQAENYLKLYKHIKKI